MSLQVCVQLHSCGAQGHLALHAYTNLLSLKFLSCMADGETLLLSAKLTRA